MHTGYLHWMSYKQAQEIFKKRHGKVAKTCWIADIKHEHGKTSGPAHNRQGDRKYPCPKSDRPNLTKVLKELKMI